MKSRIVLSLLSTVLTFFVFGQTLYVPGGVNNVQSTTNTGMVGIGTDAPKAALDVTNTPDGKYGLQVYSDNSGRGFQMVTKDFVYTGAGSALKFNFEGIGNTYAWMQAYKDGVFTNGQPVVL